MGKGDRTTVNDEDSSAALAEFLALQPVAWPASSSEPNSRRGSMGGPNANEGAQGRNTRAPAPFSDGFLDSIGCHRLTGQSRRPSTAAAPPPASPPPRRSAPFAEGSDAGGTSFSFAAYFPTADNASPLQPTFCPSSPPTADAYRHADEGRGESALEASRATVEAFYRECLRMERDVEADERCLWAMKQVEGELKKLLSWTRELSAELTGEENPRDRSSYPQNRRNSGSGGGRRMESDLRMLGEVLKRLDMGEKALAPLERGYLALLKKHLLDGDAGESAGRMPAVVASAFEDFARALCLVAESGNTGGKRDSGPHVIDLILNGGANEVGADAAPGQPGREHEEIRLARERLTSLFARREEVRRTLLDELLFQSKNEGGGRGNGQRPSQSPFAALAAEERCVLSGRASDTETVLGPVSRGNHHPQSSCSHEEDPILIVNVENCLPGAAADGEDNNGSYSPGFLAQLRQYDEFQSASYPFPSSRDSTASAEGRRPSFLTVATTPARFACFHIIETARRVLCHLQARVDSLLSQRQCNLQHAFGSQSSLTVDVYDPSFTSVEEERDRWEREMAVFSSWKAMVQKLFDRVVVPLRERVLSSIMQQAMVRRGLLEVLAQRTEDGNGHRRLPISHRNQNRLNGSPVKEGSSVTSVAAATSLEEHPRPHSGSGGEVEGRFSHCASDTTERHDEMPRQPGEGPCAPPLPRASAAFIAFLEDIAREQERVLRSRRDTAEDSAAATVSRKRGREVDEAKTSEAVYDDVQQREPLTPFVELDVSSVTASRESSSTNHPSNNPDVALDDNDANSKPSPQNEACQAEVMPDNGVTTAALSTTATADAIQCQDPQSTQDKACEEVPSADVESPAVPLAGPRRRDSEDEEEDEEETGQEGPSPTKETRGGKRGKKRVYGLRTYRSTNSDDSSDDDDGDSDGETSDESGGGGLLWKGLGAFVKAVVHRATTFSESDDDDEGGEEVQRTSKRRRL